MENNQTSKEVIKKEAVGYLKSKINLQQGTLILTDNKLSLEAHKTGVGGFGLIGALLKRKVEKVNTIFDLELNKISSVAQGKHGVQNNVLEITDNDNVTHRIMVKNFSEWEEVITKRK